MFRPTADSRIYLLDEDERQTTPDGPALIGPDGTREEIPPGVFEAVQQVIEAMEAGRGVKVSPLRTELPIDEAADAFAIGRDDLRKHAAADDIPFRSSPYVDWVRLSDVIDWDTERRRARRAALDEMLRRAPGTDGAGS